MRLRLCDNSDAPFDIENLNDLYAARDLSDSISFQSVTKEPNELFQNWPVPFVLIPVRLSPVMSGEPCYWGVIDETGAIDPFYGYTNKDDVARVKFRVKVRPVAFHVIMFPEPDWAEMFYKWQPVR